MQRTDFIILISVYIEGTFQVCEYLYTFLTNVDTCSVMHVVQFSWVNCGSVGVHIFNLHC